MYYYYTRRRDRGGGGGENYFRSLSRDSYKQLTQSPFYLFVHLAGMDIENIIFISVNKIEKGKSKRERESGVRMVKENNYIANNI